MHRLSSLALALVLVTAQVLFAAPGAAQGQPGKPPDRLRLVIDRMSPRMVGAEDTTFTVSATVTNTGDRPISDVVARVQAGPRQETARQLGRTLTESPPAETGASPWVGVADTLPRGRSARLSISVPLATLGVSGPGVYPLLLNVNGTPAYGGPARLAASHVLLPVFGAGEAGATPVPVSVLWPIAGREPKIVAAPHDGPVVLSDDDLAAELAPGGRLHALVEVAESHRDDPGIFRGLCFAVDPDLLETVDAMTGGYRVRTPSGHVDGRGGQAAQRWLESLRRLVANHCVIQTPYADADLTALSRVESGINLVGEAVSNGATVLNLLRIEPRPGVLWSEGEVNDDALRAAADAGTTTLVADPARVNSTGEGTEPGVRLVAPDPLVAVAFENTAVGGPAAGGSVRAEGVDVATQNAVGAMALRAGLGTAPGGDPVLVAPPHAWNATADDLVTVLGSLERLYGARLVDPAPLDELLTPPAGDEQHNGAAPSPKRANGTGELAPMPGEAVESLSEVEATTADLQSAMSVDPTRQVQPVSLMRPLHNAVLRATSTAWRSDVDRLAAASAARAQVEAMSNRVTVNTPSQPVSLTSESSPLPVTLSNELPVAITVRINLENSAGLRPAEVADTPLAANSRVSRLIPAETLRSGRFIVDVSVTTPRGTALGTPARMELTSSELGVFTVVLTATAGAALLLLSGLRIYRRVQTRRVDRG